MKGMRMKGALALAGLLAYSGFAEPMTISVCPVAGDATATIQKAFDDCFRAGGGTVTVAEGEGDTMRFKVTPGDGSATRAFLRVKVK